ncbi:glycerophosphodiester phosphodiesterase family protein [Paucilactobacillus hokkaidonensis JCM 18461]|uniref:Glycerophosphodiester phosphodiesterase family protein n=2 Tax=Paucilactobacillus hokkaidonensis TaxID=1193095 RepID=A0A0A1GUY5_9LACO|nr:glycerophosphodiester phosphodiesterase family protein [Paucilactobacillus hokkaidonensis]BAP86082.1 glycerophosphodiester phosphodiesterase family protein [Paucilactobacillus hokkaidonensis JCM 18461]
MTKRIELTGIMWVLVIINNWLLANIKLATWIKISCLFCSLLIVIAWVSYQLKAQENIGKTSWIVGLSLLIGWIMLLPLGGLGLTSHVINLIYIPQTALRVLYLRRILIVPVIAICYCSLLVLWWRQLRGWILRSLNPHFATGSLFTNQFFKSFGIQLLVTIVGFGLMYLCVNWIAKANDFLGGAMLLLIGTWILANWISFLITQYFQLQLTSEPNVIIGIGLMVASVLLVIGWTQSLNYSSQLKTPEIISHRGVDGHNGVQNTVQSLHKTSEKKPAAIEMDIQETEDKSFVCFHDVNLKGLARRNTTVHNLRIARLQRISLSEHGFKTPVSTFNQYLKRARQQHLIVEIKPQHVSPTQVAQTFGSHYADKLESRHDKVHSVDDQIIAQLHRSYPRLSVGLIRPFVISRLATKDVNFYSLDYRTVNQQTVQFLHAHHKKVYVWTVDKPQVAQRMLQLGVDGIITDRLSLIRAKINVMKAPVTTRVTNVLWQLI